MNLNHLHYFYVFAKHRSVTAAAEELGISQPSLSQQLRIFENEIGVPLFLRKGKSIELSTKGRWLYDRSLSLFDVVDEIDFAMKRYDFDRSEMFEIAVANEIERPFVAEIVGEVIKTRKAQKHKFVVRSKGHDILAKELRATKADLFITNSPLLDRKPSHEFELPVVLVTSLDVKDTRPLNDLSFSAILAQLNQGLIAPSEDLSLRRELNDFLLKSKFQPPLVFESNILACIVRAAQKGIGCAFVPLPYVFQDQQRGTLKVLGPTRGFWQHKLYFYSQSSDDFGIVKHMAQIVQEYTR